MPLLSVYSRVYLECFIIRYRWTRSLTTRKHKHESVVICETVLWESECEFNLESVVVNLQFCSCSRLEHLHWIIAIRILTPHTSMNNCNPYIEQVCVLANSLFFNILFFLFECVRYFRCYLLLPVYYSDRCQNQNGIIRFLFVISKLICQNHWTDTQMEKMQNLHSWINMREFFFYWNRSRAIAHYLIN